MRRVATIASVLVIVLTGAYLAASWYLVRVMVTIDRKPGRLTPVELGFPDAEELSFIASNGVRLIGWFAPSTTDQVIVLVHDIYSNAWDCQGHREQQESQDEESSGLSRWARISRRNLC